MLILCYCFSFQIVHIVTINMDGADVFRRYMIEGGDQENITDEETLALTRFRLEQNSETFAIKELVFGDYVPNDEYTPHDGDWARDGATIGANKYLKQLYFERSHEVPEKDYERFFRGVAKSKSIEKLYFEHTTYHGGKIFQILTRLIAKNKNFRHLVIKDTMDEPSAIYYIIAMFENSKGSTMERLELTSTSAFWDIVDGGFGDDETGESNAPLINKFFASLYGLSSLTHLNLSSNCIQKVASTALASFLRHPSCKVKHLNIAANGLNCECSEILAGALSEESGTLEELILVECGRIKEIGWEAFARLLESPHCKIKYFHCGMTSGGDIISNSLSTNKTLTKLSLDVQTDEAVISLVNWMATSNNSLVDLTFGDFSSLGAQSYIALASNLSSPGCTLTRLGIHSWSVSDESAIVFTDALKVNKSLLSLSLSGRCKWQWNLFENALCDGSSIEATYLSNHTLQKISYGHCGEKPSDEVSLYLGMNELSRTKLEAAGLKIYSKHLSKDGFSMEPFENMSLKIMPHVIAYMGKGGDRFLMYNFVKGLASFVDLSSTATIMANGTESESNLIKAWNAAGKDEREAFLASAGLSSSTKPLSITL